jgi:hypothetical protein
MANLNTLKGLFSKLRPAAKTIANYGDDVARAVVNYGDDVAGVVSNYGDDAARALTNYGDDAASAAITGADDLSDIFDSNGNLLDSDTVTIGGKQFHYPDLEQYEDEWGTLYMSEQARQARLKDHLLSKRMHGMPNFRGHAARVPVSGYDLMPTSYSSVPYSLYPPEKVTALGDYVDGIPTAHAVQVPELSSKDLVVQQQDLDMGWPYNEFAYGVRPHRNTKLGKWFRQQMPTYGFEIDVDPLTGAHYYDPDRLPF